MSRIAHAFADQAAACRALGSGLTARICERLGAGLAQDAGAVARRVRNWPGDPAGSADSVPLRLAGALHALVLTESAPDLAAAYAGGDPPAALLLASIAAHEDFVLDWLGHPPQTNEVARSAAIIAAARFASAIHPLPIEALELGASAGLNLNFHRYRLSPLADASGGDISAPKMGLVLSPDWRGEVPQAAFRVAEAAGVDLNPLDPVAGALRLLAYCWPDQPQRLARLRAAIGIARAHPPQVARGDAADWLAARLARPALGRLRMVFHTVAWQYFPPPVQAACIVALSRAGAAAHPGAPLARFAMEADGRGEGAGLTLHLWDGRARRWALGRADFHGRWIDWSPREIVPAESDEGTGDGLGAGGPAR